LLDFSNNQITHIPDSLSHLTNLQGLVLSKNQITFIPEAVFLALSKLETAVINDPYLERNGLYLQVNPLPQHYIDLIGLGEQPGQTVRLYEHFRKVAGEKNNTLLKDVSSKKTLPASENFILTPQNKIDIDETASESEKKDYAKELYAPLKKQIKTFLSKTSKNQQKEAEHLTALLKALGTSFDKVKAGRISSPYRVIEADVKVFTKEKAESPFLDNELTDYVAIQLNARDFLLCYKDFSDIERAIRARNITDENAHNIDVILEPVSEELAKHPSAVTAKTVKALKRGAIPLTKQAKNDQTADELNKFYNFSLKAITKYLVDSGKAARKGSLKGVEKASQYGMTMLLGFVALKISELSGFSDFLSLKNIINLIKPK
jgi:hypothetical protein